MGCFGKKEKKQPAYAQQPAYSAPPAAQPTPQTPPPPTPQQQQQSAGPETPKPFAVMRMTHEAFRAAFQETMDLCNVGDFMGAATTFNALAGAIPVHTRQEEQTMFPMLARKFPNDCRFQTSSGEHAGEQQRIAACTQGLQRAMYGQPQGVSEMIAEFQQYYETHMKGEEDMMMPVTEKTAATVEERGALMHQVLNTDMQSFERIQIPFVVRMLDMKRPPGMLKNFVWGLQYSSTPSEFARHTQQIRSIVKPESADMLQKAGCFGPGKLPEGYPGPGIGPMAPVIQAVTPVQSYVQPMQQPPPQQFIAAPPSVQPPQQTFIAGPPSVQSFYGQGTQMPPPSVMQQQQQPQMMMMQLQPPPQQQQVTIVQQQQQQPHFPMQMQTGGFQPHVQPMQPMMHQGFMQQGGFGMERESDL